MLHITRTFCSNYYLIYNAVALARAPQGGKVEDVKRGARSGRENVIGALCGGGRLAIECCKHAAGGGFFENRFKDCLLPAIPKGHTVIMDNASSRRKARLRKAARGTARLLFLPPYSPGYNPIEKSWANMKRFLRDNIQKFQSLSDAVYEYFHVPVI
ncbi:MAG: transposase [Treponema sp.]|jgi:hypothetical protein|nr:transposase [Treponema sp.]